MAQAISAIQRMQKALIEMNIQLSNVLSDLSGVSGMAIVQAILDGERGPSKLAALADPQVKASRAVIAKSLEGNWRPELCSCCARKWRCTEPARTKSPPVTSSCSIICKP